MSFGWLKSSTSSDAYFRMQEKRERRQPSRPFLPGRIGISFCELTWLDLNPVPLLCNTELHHGQKQMDLLKSLDGTLGLGNSRTGVMAG
jgi:hypothetical protein